MHELSLMEGVLAVLEEERGRHGFQRVVRIVLEIGVLAGVEREALAFCHEAVAAGTVADGATLELVDVPAMAWCGRCEAEVPVESRLDFCPNCGGVPARLIRGVDLRVKSIEVE